MVLFLFKKHICIHILTVNSCSFKKETTLVCIFFKNAYSFKKIQHYLCASHQHIQAYKHSKIKICIRKKLYCMTNNVFLICYVSKTNYLQCLI